MKVYVSTIQRPTSSFVLMTPTGQLFIVHNSPVLKEKTLISDNPQPKLTASTISKESDVDSEHAANAFQVSVAQLSIDGAILFSLLTYIFPVLPVRPPTVEQVMEILAIAQKYKMRAILVHIRNRHLFGKKLRSLFILFPRSTASI